MLGACPCTIAIGLTGDVMTPEVKLDDCRWCAQSAGDRWLVIAGVMSYHLVCLHAAALGMVNIMSQHPLALLHMSLSFWLMS